MLQQRVEKSFAWLWKQKGWMQKSEGWKCLVKQLLSHPLKSTLFTVKNFCIIGCPRKIRTI